jgi:hypothetical protein
MRFAPFGQIEISGTDLPRVSVEHIESAAQRANRDKVEATAPPQRVSRRLWNVFEPSASGPGYPGPELLSRNLAAVGSP